MPRTRDPQRIGRYTRVAGSIGDRIAENVAQAQRPALMRAAVADRVEVLAHPEHADRAAADGDDSALAVKKGAHGGHDDPHHERRLGDNRRIAPVLSQAPGVHTASGPRRANRPLGIKTTAKTAAASRQPPDTSTARCSPSTNALA